MKMGPQRFFSFIIAMGTIAIGVLSSDGVPVKEDNVCSSKECVSTARTILANMDQEVDPCTDFYQFACGIVTKASENGESGDYFSILKKKINNDLAQMINYEIEPDEPKIFKLVKTLHKSCMNMDTAEAHGLESLQDYLRRFGGWPVVDGDAWNEEKFDWRRTIYKFRRDGDNEDYIIGDGIGYLIGFRIAADKRNPLKRVLTFFQPDGLISPGTTEEDFENGWKPHLRHYYNVMVDIATMLGADNNRAKSELREIISFELEVANIKVPAEELYTLEHNDPLSLYNPMSIAEMNEKYPSVPWMKYIRYFVGSRINVTEEDIVNVQVPDYYVKLEALMAATSKRTQANYVVSRIALRNAVFSTELMRHTIYKFLATIMHSPSIRNRADYCLGQVIENLRLAVAAMYVKVFFSEETRKNAAALTSEIMLRLNETLGSIDWMDEPTKRVALEKLAAMKFHVGYPEVLVDHQKLEEYYGDLEFTEDDYFGNIDKLSSHDLGVGIAELRQPENRTDWKESLEAITTNAAYAEMTNSIRIPAAILQGLYYGKDRPNYMNYGAIGATIAHEMTHAFFVVGSRHGKDGKPQDWWSAATKRNFEERSRCIIDQYKNFRVDDKDTKLDSEKTFEEDLADIGGLRLAHGAYKNSLMNRPDSRGMPGLEKYSTEQMFWISAASVACARINAEWIPDLIKYEEHTLARFRVIGPFSNMPEFAEDFNCKEISLMNPEERCALW